MATPLRRILTSIHGRLLGLDAQGGGANGLIVKGEPDQIVMTVAKGGSANITLVTLQACDNEGFSVAKVLNGIVWLSDAATGAGLTATSASGNVVAGTAGTDLGDLTSKKAKTFQTDATGKYILSITDTAKTAFYVCAKLDAGRYVPAQILQLAAANYA
jgi:hypothetical protein